MRAKAVTTAFLALSFGAAVSSLFAQSLADVAKKEEERRKQIGSAGKVYTNKDLKPVPMAEAPPPTASAAAAAGDAANKDADKAAAADPGNKDKAAAAGTPAAGDKAAADKGQVKDQAYWAGRRKALADALERDQSRINALTTDFVNRDDPAQKSVIERDRIKALAQLDGLKKQIADDKKALADFEEEARRAGVPPGWIR